MYIVAIAWLYVTLMISFLQPGVFIGIITFIGTGLFPLTLLLYITGGPRRMLERRRRQAATGSTPVDPDQ